MNFWIALLPSAKTSAVLKFTGVPFERAIRYHKLASILVVFGALTHLLLNRKLQASIMYSFDSVGTKEIVPVYGFISFILICSMGLMAVEPIRRAQYEIFKIFHYLYIPAIIFAILHWYTIGNLCSVVP